MKAYGYTIQSPSQRPSSKASECSNYNWIQSTFPKSAAVLKLDPCQLREHKLFGGVISHLRDSLVASKQQLTMEDPGLRLAERVVLELMES